MSLAYPPLADQSCDNCRFERHGLCCRHAPMPITAPDQSGKGYPVSNWPEVEEEEWCGEWAPREAQP